LARPLPSARSADDAAVPPLFADFLGTMGLSDSLCPFIAVVLLSDSRRGPLGASAGPHGSRVRGFRTCSGSSTTRAGAALAIACGPVLPSA